MSSPDSDPALCRYPDCRPASARARSGATAPGLGGLASEPPRRAHSESARVCVCVGVCVWVCVGVCVCVCVCV